MDCSVGAVGKQQEFNPVHFTNHLVGGIPQGLAGVHDFTSDDCRHETGAELVLDAWSGMDPGHIIPKLALEYRILGFRRIPEMIDPVHLLRPEILRGCDAAETLQVHILLPSGIVVLDTKGVPFLSERDVLGQGLGNNRPLSLLYLRLQDLGGLHYL